MLILFGCLDEFSTKYGHLDPEDFQKILKAASPSNHSSNQPATCRSTTGAKPSDNSAASNRVQSRAPAPDHVTPSRTRGGSNRAQATGANKTSSSSRHGIDRSRANPKAAGSAKQPHPNANNRLLERTLVQTPARVAVPNPPPAEEEHEVDMEEAANVEEMATGTSCSLTLAFSNRCMFVEPSDSSKEKTETKKEMARLSKFGHAAPLVQLLTARIKLLTHKVCPFGDTLLNDIMAEYEAGNDLDQAHAHDEAMKSYTCLLDKWLVDSWAELNEIKRPNEEPLPLEESYCRYVSLFFRLYHSILIQNTGSATYIFFPT